MKKYNITVNGTTYEVYVEEADASAAPAPVVKVQQEAEQKAEEIEKSVAAIIENAVNAVEEELAAEEDDDTKIFEFPESTETKKPKFEFLDLQFGDDVDITK